MEQLTLYDLSRRKNQFSLAKILILKQEGTMENISYECRFYESVDNNRSLS